MLEDLIIESGESLTNTLMRFAIAGMLVRHFDELKLFDVALEQLELAEDEDRLKVRRRPPAVDGLASTLVGTLDRTRRSQSPGTRGGVAVVREPTMLDGDLVPRWREDTVIRINICFTSVP